MKLVRLGDFMENMVACSIVCHGILHSIPSKDQVRQ